MEDNRWHSPVVKASVVLLAALRFSRRAQTLRCAAFAAWAVGPVILIGLAIVSERNASLEYGQLMRNNE